MEILGEPERRRASLPEPLPCCRMRPPRLAGFAPVTSPPRVRRTQWLGPPRGPPRPSYMSTRRSDPVELGRSVLLGRLLAFPGCFDCGPFFLALNICRSSPVNTQGRVEPVDDQDRGPLGHPSQLQGRCLVPWRQSRYRQAVVGIMGPTRVVLCGNCARFWRCCYRARDIQGILPISPPWEQVPSDPPCP